MKPKSPTKERVHSMKLRERIQGRVLFGKPDLEKTNQWLKQRQTDRLQQAKERWNFDFEKFEPCSSSEAGGNEKVEFELVPEDQVPNFYRSKTSKVTVEKHLQTPRKRLRSESMESDIQNTTVEIIQEVAIKSPKKIRLAKYMSAYETPKKAPKM
ncbi:unnamed protein product [Bursaphelenchus okinawaensis]|uniref:Cyclin-dependent kinase inhibitor domain-containing protein n=1 Tax=Bursaphelenchus okinawaensis TaxID=465554 RepID=A0A811K6K1_9BILA|nr:unnamed protein product [Bursaphelenchus okinawaensis]CAG9093371.1 unnamed protein product [Bursaphelenchus okinawaensis]